MDISEVVGLLRRLGLAGSERRRAGGGGTWRPVGADAVLAHRLARGLDRVPVPPGPPAELAVELELDPPVDRVDAAAFAARTLAQRLTACCRNTGCRAPPRVEARTVAGRSLAASGAAPSRSPRAAPADRVRWQLDSSLVRVVTGRWTGCGWSPRRRSPRARCNSGCGAMSGRRASGRGARWSGAGAARAGGVVTAVLGGGRTRGAGPVGALGGRPRWPADLQQAGGATTPGPVRRGPRRSAGAGTTSAVAGRLPPPSPACPPEPLPPTCASPGAAGAARRPGPAHRPAARAVDAGRPRACAVGRTVAGRAAVVGAGAVAEAGSGAPRGRGGVPAVPGARPGGRWWCSL